MFDKICTALPRLLLCSLLLHAGLLRAQPVGDYSGGFERKGNTLSFQTSQARVQIEFCTGAMFRVRTSWDNTFEAPEHLMVSKYNWSPVSLTTRETSEGFSLQTDVLRVEVQTRPFALSVYNREGRLLSRDGAMAAERKGSEVKASKQLQADEHFFGFGERMDFLDRRGKQLSLNVGRGKGKPHAVGAYNILEANYSPAPFFMSTRGYGIFLHNSFATTWDMGATNNDEYSFAAVDGELDYYFIYGPRFGDILNHYTDLTGKSPMIPKFALGLHAGTYSGGTWGHEDQSSDTYVIQWAKKFRELGIPVDLLWLDSTWRIFGKEGGKGATSFEWRDTFANPKGMFDSLYALNYKMVGLHLRPRFDNGNKLDLLDQARQKGFVYPEPGNKGDFVNFFDSRSVDWWWENGVKRVASIGARFLKTDEGSAFGGLANESDKTGPTDKTAQKLHNVFPIAYARAPYEKFQAFNKIRGLNQTREGYAGIQRYPFIFAGDWPSEWQYFGPVLRAGLNIGMSGVGYWTHCMGGFEHVADPELYNRWVQFGMFSPLAMLFGMEHPSYKEPWRYGPEALANFIKYDKLRYRLIPYLYSYAWQMYKTGMPLMRALPLEYQDDANVYGIDDQYLLGADLLVCPVLTKGAQTRVVYLPKGEWYDYWTGKKYEGQQFRNVVCPPDQLPLFVRAGGIIPMQDDMLYTDEKPLKHLSLEIFPGANTSFDLYEDDGLSLDYQTKQAYAITRISQQRADATHTITVEMPAGKFKPAARSYSFLIHWPQGAAPKQVILNGHQLSSSASVQEDSTWFYDQAAATISIRCAEPQAQAIKLTIQ